MIVGDTALSQNDHANKLAIIKTGILSSTATLSFSGSPSVAEVGFQELQLQNDLSFEALKRILLPIHVSSGGASEFLCTIDDRIFVVRDGRAKAVDHAWIGDYGGFRAFQGYRLGHTEVPPNSPSHWLSVFFTDNLHEGGADAIRLMKLVIGDTSLVSIGGAPYLVSNFGGAFRYEPYTELSIGDGSALPDGTFLPNPTSEFFSHRFSFGANNNIGSPTLVAYYAAGALAYVFGNDVEQSFPSLVGTEQNVDPVHAAKDIAARIGADFDMIEMAHSNQI